MKHRLNAAFGEQIQFEVIGDPISLPDAQALAAQAPFQFQFWALGLVDARPTEMSRGPDQGIDGRLYFHDEPKAKKTKQIIFSVKAGNVSVSHVRDLRGVIEREEAEIGVLISMKVPTKPMRREAASSGFYDSPWGTKHPRIQLFTIEELLAGARVDYPPTQANVTFKKAPRVTKEGGKAVRLFDDE